MKYYKGRNNLAATVFIPVKCGNNCPFCNTNKLYKDFDYKDVYLDNILRSIELCNCCDAVSEFVITGGEPLLDLEILKKIISVMDKPVYINTSLPLVNNIHECIEYINSEEKIHGINISRHINTIHSVKTAGVAIIDKIQKYVRINCIIDETDLGENLLEFINTYATPYRMINFRADYRNITTDTLKNRDSISNWLLNNFKFEYSNNCLVCNSEFYSDEENFVICYHRGLKHSSVEVLNRTYVNDIIIDIYGGIYKDWNMINDHNFYKALIENKIS